ncbi:MAG: hypothetical protein E2P02_24425, partial [Acidobacteria bacterium]
MASALLSAVCTSAFAQAPIQEMRGQAFREVSRYEVQKTRGRTGWVSVIVKLEDEPLAAYRGGVSGLPATSPMVTGAGRLDVRSPACQAYMGYLDGKQRAFEDACSRIIPDAFITHSYKIVFGGVALAVPEDQV